MSEHTPTLSRVINDAIKAGLTEIHTALPGTVESYDPVRQSANVQPTVMRRYVSENGEVVAESLPQITDVPVVFPGAGGMRITFPVQRGDTVLLIFTEASIERWLTRGVNADPEDDRRHALTDAIAIPGLRSFASPLTSAPTDRATIGADSGARIELKSDEITITDQNGGGEPAARKGDQIRATIPIGTVLVAATGGVLNATPIQLDGEIMEGSSILKVK